MYKWIIVNTYIMHFVVEIISKVINILHSLFHCILICINSPTLDGSINILVYRYFDNEKIVRRDCVNFQIFSFIFLI